MPHLAAFSVLVRSLAACSLAVAIVAAGCDRSAQGGTSTQEEPATASSAAQEAQPSTPPSAERADTSAGAALYTTYCAFCHGASGEGYVADNANALSNANFLATATDEFLNDAITHGRPGTPMSAWGVEREGPLDATEVDALVAYIRSWQTSPTVVLDESPLQGSAIRGQAAWAVHCAVCHGEGGEGVQAVSLNNPRFLDGATDGYLRYAIREGRPGTAMPAYGDLLSRQVIEDVTALIRSWQRPVDGPPPTPYVPDLSNPVINPDGGDPTWDLRDELYVSVDAVKAAVDAGHAVVILDARPPSDFLGSHIEGAVNIPFYDVERHAERLPRDRWVVTYCGCPHAISVRAAESLRAAGFPKVAVLDEGINVWRDRGYGVRSASEQP